MWQSPARETTMTIAGFPREEIDRAIEKFAPGLSITLVANLLDKIEAHKGGPFQDRLRASLDEMKLRDLSEREKLRSIAGSLYGTRGARVKRENRRRGIPPKKAEPTPYKKVLEGDQWAFKI